jgi:hypothetical protein
MAGYASKVTGMKRQKWETFHDVMCLHIASPISGITFSTNIACNASAGQLASPVLRLLSPEQAFHLHLLYGGKQVDLEQTIGGIGIVDSSEVYFLCKPAPPEELREIKDKADNDKELAFLFFLLCKS